MESKQQRRALQDTAQKLQNQERQTRLELTQKLQQLRGALQEQESRTKDARGTMEAAQKDLRSIKKRHETAPTQLSLLACVAAAVGL
eukprot:scaffold354_cov234-Pinguiococcus_pyrenoidosus.AAC.3